MNKVTKWLESFHLPQLKRFSKPLSFSINLLCHVFILLTFLTMFFFKYITGLTESHIDVEMQSLVQEQADQLLNFIDKKDTQQIIRWDIIGDYADKLIKKSKNNLSFITENNKNLYDDSMCALFMMGLVIVILVAYFVFRGVNLRLKFILMENFVIFAFVGMIEIYFFMNIASKYIPVFPDDAIKSAFSRIKEKLAT